MFKGFNVSNLDVIDSKNEKLENIINKNTNFYKNSSFEYFIEDISVTYHLHYQMKIKIQIMYILLILLKI